VPCGGTEFAGFETLPTNLLSGDSRCHQAEKGSEEGDPHRQLITYLCKVEDRLIPHLLSFALGKVLNVEKNH
jgi:hypothetical protein